MVGRVHPCGGHPGETILEVVEGLRLGVPPIMIALFMIALFMVIVMRGWDVPLIWPRAVAARCGTPVENLALDDPGGPGRHHRELRDAAGAAASDPAHPAGAVVAGLDPWVIEHRDPSRTIRTTDRQVDFSSGGVDGEVPRSVVVEVGPSGDQAWRILIGCRLRRWWWCRDLWRSCRVLRHAGH